MKKERQRVPVLSIAIPGPMFWLFPVPRENAVPSWVHVELTPFRRSYLYVFNRFDPKTAMYKKSPLITD